MDQFSQQFNPTLEDLQRWNVNVENAINMASNGGINLMSAPSKAEEQQYYKDMQLRSNVGTVGIAPSYSQADPANPIYNQFPLYDWLENTYMSRRVRSAPQIFRKTYADGTFDWIIQLPYIWGTLPPQDTSGLCCWVPFDLAMCGADVPIRLLCLKDCKNMLDYLMDKVARFKTTDLLTYFMNAGDTFETAQDRLNKLSFEFLTKYTVINGTLDNETPILKPFHGLMEVILDDGVLSFLGGNILSAFAQIWCRISLMSTDGNDDWIIATNKATYASLVSMLVKDKLGNYPDGWTVQEGLTGNRISFRGIRIIEDNSVSVDLENRVGEAWILNGKNVGMWLYSNPFVSDDLVFRQFNGDKDRDEGCAEMCKYYYNAGAVFSNDPNAVMVISGIPLSFACSDKALLGLDNLINPITLVPFTGRYKKVEAIPNT